MWICPNGGERRDAPDHLQQTWRALYNFNIQPAMARPISSGESS